jgi:hypothetical protein
VLLRRYDIEAIDQRPMRRSTLETLIQEEVAPFLARFTVSNVKSQQIVQALSGFQRLCEPQWKPLERARFARKPYFPAALLLFEILVQATGEGDEALAEWVRAARRAAERREPVEAEVKTRAPRRRRRRR